MVHLRHRAKERLEGKASGKEALRNIFFPDALER